MGLFRAATLILKKEKKKMWLKQEASSLGALSSYIVVYEVAEQFLSTMCQNVITEHGQTELKHPT